MDNKRLDELIKQKKEIERQINDLKNQRLETNMCKIAFTHYPSSRPDDYYLAIKGYTDYLDKYSMKTIYRTKDKENILKYITQLLNDLKDLQELLKIEVEEDAKNK